MDYQLELIDVAKHYKDFVAVNNVSLQVKKGEIVSLLGPSGCGKTTTLRMIAGLIHPTSGSIFIEGNNMQGIPPHKRDISMVFQNYALFPHLTVYENIVYGLKMRGIKDKKVLMERAGEMMEIVQLHNVESRLPRELSGGQQQRVSLARAMIVKPRVMLFDEPLSNLDAKLREQTRVEIRNLLKNMGVTAIYVTHDQEEALTISDRIAVMNKGVIEQITTPSELYTNPANRFIANFVGHANLLEGTITQITGQSARFRTQSGLELIGKLPQNYSAEIGSHISYIIRPENILMMNPESSAENTVKGTVLAKVFLGSTIRYIINIGESRNVEMDLNARDDKGYNEGDSFPILLDPQYLVLVER